MSYSACVGHSLSYMACLQEVDALYSSAVQHFPDSALLHVFIAQYLRVYRGNRHLELLHIAAAEVSILAHFVGGNETTCFCCWQL